MTFTLSSPAFTEGGAIPMRHTCEGDDVSPPLEWSGAPDGTRSFTLIVDDPDAPDPAKPQSIFVHWVLYNIPSVAKSLHEDAIAHGLPDGAEHVKNDWKHPRYGGPCPPIGRHRYFFRLYALDTELTGLGRATRADVDRAMEGHTLATAQLMGTYQKSKR